MKNVVIGIIVLASLSFMTPFALAQFGGLGDLLGAGKSKDGASASPESVERNLKEIVGTTSTAIANLSTAIGLKEEAAKMVKNADCIQRNECSLKDAVDIVTGSSATVRNEIEKKKASGEKLGAEASKEASKAILPGVKAIPLWKRVGDDGTALSKDRSAMVKASGLIRALPEVPNAMNGSANLFKTSIDYLSFSGADTSELQSELSKGLAGL
jgi:hypothetical protein